jgi:acetyl-CoA carboxylase carboxyl transferase subunit beta
MTWFRKPKQKLQPAQRREVPADVFEKCSECGEILYSARLTQNHHVCPKCGYHLRIGVKEYLGLLLDEGEYVEYDAHLRSADPLKFFDSKAYPDRLAAAEKKSAHGDAIATVDGRLDGIPVSLAVMDFGFIGGSMGSVVGEKIARSARRSLERRQPLLIVSASGGARMQEGVLSLMQLAKSATALARLHEARIPYISIITDPTTGGTTASYAMLGDVNIAEPGALIGFAGPRVIEQTIKQELPAGFQRSEFVLQHGMLDCIVDRRHLKATVATLLRHMLGMPARRNGQAADLVAAGSGEDAGHGGGAGAAAGAEGREQSEA